MSSTDPSVSRRPDYELIETLVAPGARVLDLGCGDGQLLADLAAHKSCLARGVEIDEAAVVACIQRGVAVYHGDMLEGMSFYRESWFDTVILSQTLQQIPDPSRVIREMLRVGRTAIISFPNFGYGRLRLEFLWTGRAPKTELLPYDWFDTPNAHWCTIADFRSFCTAHDLKRVREIFLALPARQIGPFWANWRAALAIFQIQKA